MSTGLRDILSEILKIKEPIILIGEWIPSEINQFEDFVEALEAYKKGATSFMISAIDREPREPVFPSQERLALVSVTEYKPLEHIEFILKVYYPEIGAIQREDLIVRLDINGNVIYGTKVLRVRKGAEETNWISLDFLSRIITDIWEDTTEAMNALLTSYQRRILDIIYPFSITEGVERMKTHMVIASDVSILNKTLDHYNISNLKDIIFSSDISRYLLPEIYQIIGWTDENSAYIFDDALVLKGVYGLLIFTKNSEKYKQISNVYLKIKGLQNILSYIYKRLQIIWDEISILRRDIAEIYATKRIHPDDLLNIKRKLMDLKAQVNLLKSLDFSLNNGISNISQVISNGITEITKPFIVEFLQKIGIMNSVRAMPRQYEAIMGLLDSLSDELDGIISITMATLERYMHETSEKQERFNTILSILAIITFAEALDILISDFAPYMDPRLRGTITLGFIVASILILIILLKRR